MKKIYLDWTKPFLRSLVDYLTDNFVQDKHLKLQNIIIVSNNSRFNRELESELLNFCTKNNLQISGCEFFTVGQLPECLGANSNNLGLIDQQSIAEDNEQLLAWVMAFREFAQIPSNLELLKRGFAYENEIKFEMSLARRLVKLNKELSRSGLNFQDLPNQLKEKVSDYEHSRWLCLSQLYENYIAELAKRDLVDPEVYAWEQQRQGFNLNDKKVFLLNLIDISKRLRMIINSIKSDVTHLIYSSAEHAAGFDHDASLNCDYWKNQEVKIANENIYVIDQAVEQGACILNLINQFESSTKNISISYVQDSTARIIELDLKDQGFQFLSTRGNPLSHSQVGNFLEVFARHLKSRDFDSIKNLLANPVFQVLLRDRGLSSDLNFKDIISKLDQYQTDHYQKLYDLELPNVAADLNEIIHATAGLCKTFETEQNLGFWSLEIYKLLKSAFSLENIEKMKMKDRLLYESLDLSFGFLKKLENFNLSFNDFLLPAEVAFDLLHSSLCEGQFYPEIDESRIKILGQLESILDASEYLIVCDMNDGSVPEILISDWLLPNSIRTLLDLQNNDQRFAREVYFQLAHLNSKQKVIYLCPKVAANGKEVLEASRIFYNVKDSELAERVQHFLISEKYGEQVEMTDSHLPLFRVPEVKQEGLSSIAVTNFRDYLECPYRFYLKHVLKLNSQEYDAIELTAMHYGIIIHTVLQKFANSIEAKLADRDQINHCLQDHLSDYYSSNFGNNSMPALAIQRDLISQRLKSFSNWQSARRAAGWKIKESEFDLSAYNIVLDHNAGLTTLRGRIDRIDYNEITKELCIIDYKTSDYAKTPERVHKKSGRWVDLQLPLYHYALRCLEHVEAIQLAYVSLSAQKYDTQFAVAKWSEPDLEEALTKAREVAEAVYLGKFWPPNMEYESQNVGVNDPFSFMLREATL